MSAEQTRPPRRSSDDDTFEDEIILQGYIARLMTMQDQREETWLEEADLEEAARDLGLSDADLQRIEAAAAAHKQRGERFLDRQLWGEAVDAFSQATTLRPFDATLMHALARAYLGRWRATGAPADREAADRYAHRTLELDPDHTASYEVLQELKRQRVSSAVPSASKVRLSMALLMGAILLILLALGGVLLLIF